MAYGTVNADVIGTSVANTSLGAGDASTMKNRIINGDMRIDQRNVGAASPIPVSIGAGYLVDRWRYASVAVGKFTAQQNQGSVTPPTGFTNYLGLTSSAATSLGATDYYLIGQPIEGYNIADLGWGTANAKTVTLSFQVYSSLTGTFGGALQNGAGNRSYPFTYSIPTANTWTTISVTIAGDTSGTWYKDNSLGIYVWFGLGVGSTYSGTAGSWSTSTVYTATGATSVVGTSGATFYFTGVQLEVGSSATGFQYRQITDEYVLCKRYYNKSYDLTVAPGTASILGCTAMRTFGYYPTYYSGTIYFGAPMRASPTMTAYNPVSGASGTWQTAGVYSGSQAVTFNYGGNISTQWQAGDGSNNQDFTYGQWTANSEL